ncbi:LysE/ArgO family amino acid transporter [Glutamicibacter sp.]|uniref:LysE/ArgO family amino acid transporter n=1 Tax=Glutamicibacter sp. TaxID=1931995 RepID=UPI0028BEEEBF|nr:LysE/ArgO family amino acid transporter [Glutamicibacter sp.]
MLQPSLVLGFSTGLSLIVAIGAQNAFVLRQGIRKEHVLLTVALCTLSDILLIAAGVTGIGIVVERAPWILVVARIGGTVFLVCYALFALRRAISPSAMESATGKEQISGLSVAATVLMLTWLNPHVYIDTVLLLGSIGAAQGDGATAFAVGAMIASLVWFTALGFAARFLSKFFSSERSWRILDGIICVLMLTFAALLITPVFTK